MPSSSTKKPSSRYEIVPLDTVKHEAKKILTPRQLNIAINTVKLLAYYPDDVGLEIESCGDGFELRIKAPLINKQGWLRVGFWIHGTTIYIVDIFWKKENRISRADLYRINHRIRQLKQSLGGKF
jgi:phage-related protein